MKRLVFLLAVLALLLSACAPSEDQVPSAPPMTGPEEIGKYTIPMPTNEVGDFTEIS